jgi:hypothetical protein
MTTPPPPHTHATITTTPQEPARAATVTNLASAGFGSKCAAGALPGPGRACCYSELVLREEGDDRLASIYKPQARGALMKKHGYTIHAGFGDQVCARARARGARPACVCVHAPGLRPCAAGARASV